MMLLDFTAKPEEIGRWLVVAAGSVGLLLVFQRGVNAIKKDLVERMDKQDKRIDAIEARTTAQFDKLGDKVDAMSQRGRRHG